ncbi:MAG: ATP synthase subunit I [Blastocatellia bacterium]|nr:ATP synthase subunit I [Blastocatellia bacterium]
MHDFNGSTGANQSKSMDDVQQNEETPDFAPLENEQRLRIITVMVIGAGTGLAFALAGRKLALGIALGGILSLFNERWLRSSTKAMIELASATGNPSVATTSKFIFRFVVIAVVIAVAMKSGYFNLLGIGIGFAAFVVAAMVEAIYQLTIFKD